MFNLRGDDFSSRTNLRWKHEKCHRQLIENPWFAALDGVMIVNYEL